MKLELRENMNVRTKDGYISQYKYYDTTNMGKLLCIPLSNGTFANIEDIVKASYNIIDLLEVGDIIATNNLCGQITKIDKEHDRIWTTCYDGEYCSSNDIKEVLTREQFKASSYRIGD